MTEVKKPANQAKILIAEDEVATLRTLKRNLTSFGFEVFTATNGEEALAEVEAKLPDLLLLDINMPKLNGLEVCKKVREWNDLPIIILSARGEERQKVIALELGADDYLTKPFGMEELVARIRASLRRVKQKDSPVLSILTFGELSINLAQHQVLLSNQPLNLTHQQYELLKYLAQNAGRIVSHRNILQEVWGPEYAEETQYLHVFISQLRQKLENDPSRPTFIKTERGFGYRFINPNS